MCLPLAGGRADESNYLVGCRCTGLLCFWLSVGRADFLLKLQPCSVRNCTFSILFTLIQFLLKKNRQNKSLKNVLKTKVRLLFPCSFCTFNFQSNNCVQDSVILSVVTGLTSVYAATVTYSIIGFRATEKYDTCINK